MPDAQPTLFTIGHSNHTLNKFIGLLKQHNITAIADVRSIPFSRFNPHFNREALEASLCSENISYVHMGQQLGARRNFAPNLRLNACAKENRRI